jgi:hypothetical protein
VGAKTGTGTGGEEEGDDGERDKGWRETGIVAETGRGKR